MLKNKQKIFLIGVSVLILATASLIPHIAASKIQNVKINTNANEVWTKRFSEPGNTLVGGYILETDDNGLLILGSKYFGHTLSGNIILIKTDPNGNVQWQKEYEEGTGQCIIKTNDGGYLISGNTDKYYEEKCEEARLIKIDFYGNVEWDKTYGYNNTDGAFNVIQTNDNNYLITGTSYIEEDKLGPQIYFAKVDSEGNLLWQKNFGRDEYYMDSGHCSYQTNDGGFVLTGGTSLEDPHWEDVFIIKTDNDGNQEWLKTYPTPYQSLDYAYSIIQTDDGGYLMGAVQAIYRYSFTDWDIWLIKTDSEGDIEWEKLFGRRYNEDVGKNIYQTNDQGYLLTGNLGIIKDSELGIKEDICLIKFDKYGNIEYDTFFPTNTNDFGKCIIKTSDGGIVIVGDSEKSINADSYDLIVIKTYPPQDYEPTKPEGKTNGAIEKTYTYTSSAVEPTGQDIYYLWEFGDGRSTEWLGPYKSGETCTVSHKWTGSVDWDGHDTYKIRVKAKNEEGTESSWSNPLLVSMTKNKGTDKPFIRLLKILQKDLPILKLLIQTLF